MKVSDLIEELEQYDDDTEVHFSYNYGDYWSTTVAPAVDSVDMQRIIFSDYHSMDKIVDEDHEKWDDAKLVVVVS